MPNKLTAEERTKAWRKIISGRNKLFTPEYMAYLARHSFKLKPGMKCIDVGTGEGFIVFSLLKYVLPGGSITGVDCDEGLLRIARRLASKAGLTESVRFRKGDACKLPYKDNSFDRVLCQTLLMHLPEPDAGLDEMVRVAKPGGLVICIEPDNSYQISYDNAGLGDLKEWERYSAFYFRHFLEIREQKICDNMIGRRLPAMLHAKGLRDITIRRNERVLMELPEERGVGGCEHAPSKGAPAAAPLKLRKKQLAELERIVGKPLAHWLLRFKPRHEALDAELTARGEKISVTEIPLFIATGRKAG
jgi:ubiquinone/menaquinone biosynthesis C-methylase UbiE